MNITKKNHFKKCENWQKNEFKKFEYWQKMNLKSKNIVEKII